MILYLLILPQFHLLKTVQVSMLFQQKRVILNQFPFSIVLNRCKAWIWGFLWDLITRLYSIASWLCYGIAFHHAPCILLLLILLLRIIHVVCIISTHILSHIIHCWTRIIHHSLWTFWINTSVILNHAFCALLQITLFISELQLFNHVVLHLYLFINCI